MAAGSGFKTFATGDVLTAADTNGYLMQGVWVFADAAARTAAVTSPQEGNMSYLKDTNSTEYYSGSAWVAVAPAAAGGKVLQVVYGSTSTEKAVANDTWADSNLTATITPSLSTSKVLVLVAQNGIYISATSQLSALQTKLLRGGTDLITFATRASGDATAIQRFGETVSTCYLDSPATTSATTYKTQIRNYFNGSEVRVQVDNNVTSTIVLMEIGV